MQKLAGLNMNNDLPDFFNRLIDSDTTRSHQKAFNDKRQVINQYEYYSDTKAILSRQTELQKLQKLRIVNNSNWLNAKGELILPAEVVNLIDNKAYMNRHKKLAKEYGVNYLLKLAELAKTKAKPSNWYAKVTSVKNWKEQTEKMLINLFRKLSELAEELAGVGVNIEYLPYYLNAKKKLTEWNFNRCIENAKSVGVNKPPNLLAKAISNSLAQVG